MSDTQTTRSELFNVMKPVEGDEESAVDDRVESRQYETLREQYWHEIERVVTLLKETYAPEKIILFGSCGRGDFSEDSDIDLVIVKKTNKRPLDRMREVYGLVYSPDHYLALDPLVYTPEELAQHLESGDNFIGKIVREGKVLYERK